MCDFALSSEPVRNGVVEATLSLTGWAETAWRGTSFCSARPEQAYQWLQFNTTALPHSSRRVFSQGPQGSLTVLRSGRLSGSARIMAHGTTTAPNKYVIAGESALSAGSLPFSHHGCRGSASACGACLDGFRFADCGCDSGATEVTFDYAVQAGQLLQVAAIPAQWQGVGSISGELSVSFEPRGGECDLLLAAPAAGCSSAETGFDGLDTGRRDGCVAERASVAVGDRGAPVRLASRSCSLTARTVPAPFLFRRVAAADGDFVATVEVRRCRHAVGPARRWTGTPSFPTRQALPQALLPPFLLPSCSRRLAPAVMLSRLTPPSSPRHSAAATVPPRQ